MQGFYKLFLQKNKDLTFKKYKYRILEEYLGFYRYPEGIWNILPKANT
jgi:hypothetical protein